MKQGVFGACTMVVLLAASTAAAQTFTKSIRLISGTTPGSASDTVARALTEHLQANLGQPVIVENRLGAGGMIAAASVAKGEPDGHTVMVYTSAYTVAPLLQPSAGFDAQKDLVPVATLATVPTVLITATAKGYKTLADLVAAAKANPGKLNVATAGVGSSTHMNAERFRLAAGIEVVNVPLKGTPEALTEVLTGRADYYFAPAFSALSHVKEGKVVALAIGSPKRSALLPDVPTTVELGYPNSDYNFWIGGLVSARTPRPLIERLHTELNKAVQAPDVRERFAKLGVEPLTMSIAEFEAMTRKEFEDNAALIKAAGLKPN